MKLIGKIVVQSKYLLSERCPPIARYAAAFVFLISLPAFAQERLRSEPLIVTHRIGPDIVTLRADPWFAGAVSSMTFRGVEHLNSADHGRLLSAAISFDGLGECLNPTIGGSVADGSKHITSSVLRFASVDRDGLKTTTQMAYWMPPGAEHHVNPFTGQPVSDAPQPCSSTARDQTRAANTAILSDVIYTQHLTFGYRSRENVVVDSISFTNRTPHNSAVVEAITAYMPPNFNKFYDFDPATKTATLDSNVDTHPGEQDKPVILATADGSSAMGIVSFTQEPVPHYGRFRFGDTNKWNLVFRPAGPFAAGRHEYRCGIAIGTLSEVEQAMVVMTK